MPGKITFAIIKPNAVARQDTGAIIKMICETGFSIAALKMIRLSVEQASCFYAVHQGKPFYDGLVRFMTSGPVIVAVFQKEDAVESFRKLIGNTDPVKADPGTIRALFGETIQSNAIHGSDCDENAVREAGFFFANSERFGKAGEFLE